METDPLSQMSCFTKTPRKFKTYCPHSLECIRINYFQLGPKPFLPRIFRDWNRFRIMILPLSRTRWFICSLTSSHITNNGGPKQERTQQKSFALLCICHLFVSVSLTRIFITVLNCHCFSVHCIGAVMLNVSHCYHSSKTMEINCVQMKEGPYVYFRHILSVANITFK